jgi:transcriptional regulator with XRE-family HTH domain
MSQCAQAIDTSIPYWSDLEHGRRAPLTGDKLRLAAEFLQYDHEVLEGLSFEERGRVEIPLEEKAPETRSVVVRFAQVIDRLSDEDVASIKAIISKTRLGRNGDDNET